MQDKIFIEVIILIIKRPLKYKNIFIKTADYSIIMFYNKFEKMGFFLNAFSRDIIMVK